MVRRVFIRNEYLQAEETADLVSLHPVIIRWRGLEYSVDPQGFIEGQWRVAGPDHAIIKRLLRGY